MADLAVRPRGIGGNRQGACRHDQCKRRPPVGTARGVGTPLRGRDRAPLKLKALSVGRSLPICVCGTVVNSRLTFHDPLPNNGSLPPIRVEGGKPNARSFQPCSIAPVPDRGSEVGFGITRHALIVPTAGRESIA